MNASSKNTAYAQWNIIINVMRCQFTCKNTCTIPHWTGALRPLLHALHLIRLCCYRRWKPDGSLLYGKRCQVLPSCFGFFPCEGFWLVCFHKSMFWHQTGTLFLPLLKKNQSKTFSFFGFKINSKQTVIGVRVWANSDSLWTPGEMAGAHGSCHCVFCCLRNFHAQSGSRDCKHILSELLTWAYFNWLKPKHWSSSIN